MIVRPVSMQLAKISALVLLALASSVVSCRRSGLDSLDSYQSMEAAQQLVGQSYKAMASGDWHQLNSLQCAAKKKSGDPDPHDPGFKARMSQIVLDYANLVEFSEKQATVQARFHYLDSPDKQLTDSILLVKEEGVWKIC